MGNLRSLRRSVKRHPLNVWKAKKKFLKENPQPPKEEVKKPELPSGLVFQNPPSVG